MLSLKYRQKILEVYMIDEGLGITIYSMDGDYKIPDSNLGSVLSMKLILLNGAMLGMRGDNPFVPETKIPIYIVKNDERLQNLFQKKNITPEAILGSFEDTYELSDGYFIIGDEKKPEVQKVLENLKARGKYYSVIWTEVI